MFEIGILCVIGLAVGYWAALWLMGRHDDVLHGDFVHVEQPHESCPPASSTLRVDSAVTLQSLLTRIKQDLKDAAQI